MPPDFRSPAVWMRHAKSDLAFEQTPLGEHMLYETSCFHAQQAVEKSVKAVLLHFGVSFPRVHSIERLIELLPSQIPRPAELIASAKLSGYATILRYPSEIEPVTEERHSEAVQLAKAVVAWAEDMLES